MYDTLLVIHNLLRWAVVIIGLIAVARSAWGWLGKKDWGQADRISGILFTSAIDLQLLAGLVLYAISQYAWKGITDLGMAYVMSTGEYRFYAIEHVTFMLLSVVLAHLGSALPKKAASALSKHRLAAILFTLALILILAGIPWARPLLRGI